MVRGRAGAWKPGTGRQPSIEEAQSHDEWARQKPETRWPTHSRETYSQIGFRSTAPLSQEGFESLPEAGSSWQGPGVAAPKLQPLRRYEDIPPRKVSAQEAKESRGRLQSTRNEVTQQSIEGRLQNDFGVRMDHARNRAGFLIDTALERAHSTGQKEPTGQRFYGETERAKIGKAARRQGLPFETMTGMTAEMSPQVGWQREGRDVNLNIAEQVAEHERTGAPGKVQLETGLPSSVARAEQVFHEGKTPHDLPGRSTPRGAPKVQSFYQNFMNPHDPRGRTTVDTHAITGMTGLPKERGESILRIAGGYEAMDASMRQAATSRGLTGPEGQAVAWFEQKRRNEGGLTGRSAHNVTMAKMHAAEAQEREVSGQQDVFGSETTQDPVSIERRRRRTEAQYAPRPKSRNINTKQFTDEDYKDQPF